MDATTVGPSRPRRVRDDDDRARRRPRAIDRHRRRDPSSSSRSIDRSIVPSSSESKSCSTNNPNDGRIDRSRESVRSFVRSFVRSRHAPPPPVSAPLLSPARPRSLASDTRATTTRVGQSSGSSTDPRVARPSPVRRVAGKMDTDATSRLSVSQWWVFNHSLVV